MGYHGAGRARELVSGQRERRSLQEDELLA